MVPILVLATVIALNTFMAVFRLSEGASAAGSLHAATAVFAFCVFLYIAKN